MNAGRAGQQGEDEEVNLGWEETESSAGIVSLKIGIEATGSVGDDAGSNRFTSYEKRAGFYLKIEVNLRGESRGPCQFVGHLRLRRPERGVRYAVRNAFRFT